MRSHTPPPVFFQQRLWSARQMSEIATAQWEALGEPFRISSQLTAMVMANHPEAVALMSACHSPLILLPPEPRSWRSSPPIPPGTRLVLTPALAYLEAQAAPLGFQVKTLRKSDDPPSARTIPFLTCPGLVFFTSGSTGLPRPVYRKTTSLLEASATLTEAIGFPPGAGVIAALPLDRSYGMNNCLMAATVLNRPLGLLERFEHNELFALFDTGKYWYWAGAPVMADILSRSQPSEPHAAPRICAFAGRLSAPVCRAFEARFGISLRQIYGTTETLTVTMDLAPNWEVRPEMAGRPLPSVAVRIGDDPHVPSRVGEVGRIWVRSPWTIEGYGFPPDLELVRTREGWWPSPDIGRLDANGYLTLLGRLDDCIRTGAGHIVNPHEIKKILERYPGITDTAVGPLETPTGPVLGALVQISGPLRSVDLRNHLARSLPRRAQPRVIETIEELPRLSSGRTDRRACLKILEEALRRNKPHDY